MSPRPAGGLGYGLRALRAYVLFVPAAIGLALAMAYPLAAARLRAARKGWERSFGNADDLRARYPSGGDSPAAQALDRLARPLELRVIRTEDDKARDEKNGYWKSPQEDLLTAAGRYVTEHSWAYEERIGPPPREVAAFLEQKAGPLAAVEGLLRSRPTLTWAQDIDAGQAGPLPNLLGHRHLANLLGSRALVSLRSGREADAERSLEAAWVHAVSLNSHPQVISKLIAVSLIQMSAGAVRHLPRPSADWTQNLGQGEMQPSFLDAYHFEAYGYEVFGGRPVGALDVDVIAGGSPAPDTPVNRVIRLLSVPWIRFCIAGFSHELRRRTEALRREDPCAFDGEAIEASVHAEVPRWNIIGRMVTPSLLKGWQSAVESDLRLELALQVLAVRGAARARGRVGEEDLRPVPSKVCTGMQWTKQREGPGRLVIMPAPLPFPQTKGRDWKVRLSAS